MTQENVIEKLKIITSRIPNFINVTNYKIENLNDLMNTKETEMFHNIIGIPLETFNMLVDKNVINYHNLDRTIRSYVEGQLYKIKN